MLRTPKLIEVKSKRNSEGQQTLPFSIQDLMDIASPIRLRFTKLLCTALYCDEPEADSTWRSPIDGCLGLCGGRTELLSEVLQTRFFDKRTPLYWVVCNSTPPMYDGRCLSHGLPPILRELLGHCAPKLSQVAFDDIEHACCMKNDDRLYKILQDHPLLSDPSVSGLFEHPITYYSHGLTLKFTIPNFIDRMLMSHPVKIKFIVEHALYSLTFEPSQQWTATIVRMKTNPIGTFTDTSSVSFRLTKINFKEGKARQGDWTWFEQDLPFNEDVGGYSAVINLNRLRQRNAYVGKDREIQGELRLHT